MSVQNCIPLFPDEEIPLILNLVLDHASTLKKLSETEHEDDLSDRLVKRLRLDQRVRSCPFNFSREFRIYDENLETAGHEGRIDICFLCPGGDQTYFAIEAKNLHVTYPTGRKSKISDYVSGDQGMMCFVTGKYSATQRAGAMLGYVFDGDITTARDGISKSILNNVKTLNLSDPNGMIKSNIVKRREQVDETRHRFGHRPFVIYHMLRPV